MSFTPATTATHQFLELALRKVNGQILQTKQIRELVRVEAPEVGERIQWLHPSDHCENHVPKGACECGGTENALLARVERGMYKVRLQNTVQ